MKNTIITKMNGDGEIILNEESLDSLADLSGALTLKCVIPEDVDIETDQRARYLANIIHLSSVFLGLALFHPEMFVSLLEEEDIADIKYDTATSKEDIENKVRKIKEEMYS